LAGAALAAPDVRVRLDAAATPLTIEQLVEIRHPSNPSWSPDGRLILYTSERAGVPSLVVADTSSSHRGTTSSSAEPSVNGRVVATLETGQPANAFWGADSKTVYFSRSGDLWQVGADGSGSRPVWTTSAQEVSIVPSPDVTRVAFARTAEAGMDLWARTLADGTETKIAHDAASIGGIAWSPDGAHLGFLAGAKNIRHEETPDYSGAKIIYTITERTPSQAFVVSSTGGTPKAIADPRAVSGGRWIDRSHVVFDRQGSDYKTRSIFVATALTGKTETLYAETDPKFWSIPGQADPAARPSPDGKWIAFVSDRDGWDHLYVMPSGGGDAVQITKGQFEAWRPSWSPDSTRLVFDANERLRPGTRHLGVATIGTDPKRATVAMITTGRGTNTWATWSPDGKRLVYQHTDPQNSADLFVVDATAPQVPVRLSESMPPGMDRSAFIEPELVHYPGPDGQQVPGYLFVPKGLDRTRKHPAIVWIHGDGVNQNYDGWHVQRNYAVYYSFHQYLLQKGYVVFAPDYRGSIGYGRAWRQGVYMDVGGNDAKDAWMAAHYLRTLGYVDMDRVGVWGLSYGGFFTLIAMTDQPTLYRAGINVAGVADYAMYYKDPYRGAWTTMRIGTPEQNPKVYAQASPVSRIDRLARPLLTLHGTSDVNVPYLHAVRIVDEALKKGKGDLVEFMVYPGEFHYFTREHVLLDAWRRVERFFDKHLQGRSATN
jgi:dipeptidyl aminopeptidase/acylaminoacyl peptidase